MRVCMQATAEFCSEALCDADVVAFALGNFVCWGAPSDSPEAAHLTRLLHVRAQPFMAILAPAEASTSSSMQVPARIRVLAALNGAPAAPMGPQLLALLQSGTEQATQLATESTRRQQAAAASAAEARSLREEQDAALAVSMAEDRRRGEEAAAARRKAAEAKEAEEAEQRAVQCAPPPPALALRSHAGLEPHLHISGRRSIVHRQSDSEQLGLAFSINHTFTSIVVLPSPMPH